MNFSSVVINWYHLNKRDLPWRNTKDPYKIWLSEIILQQTRVEQGLPYYHRFLKQYPTIKKLAAAKEQEVLKLWQGLGYYSRARNLHHAAKEIMKRFKGKFPATYPEIRSLKGVGDYTASAIAAFAFNLPHAAIDGNVFRLLSRYFGIKAPINSTKGKKIFNDLASELINSLDDKNYADFNQAIIEFGAMQCKPSNPDCLQCPLSASCFAYAKKKVRSLPVKLKKQSIRTRYFYYLVVSHKNTIYLKKRTSNDIWKNLYDFPLIESKKKLSASSLLEECKKVCGKAHIIRQVESLSHQLSHQTIIASFIELNVKDKWRLPGVKQVNPKQLHLYPVPKLIERYLESK